MNLATNPIQDAFEADLRKPVTYFKLTCDSHDLEYCQQPWDFPKKYGRWQVRCRNCDYKSYLIADKPPATPKPNQTKDQQNTKSERD